MSNVFNTILLVALPASGKSEVRNFMANIEPERLQKDFHIGENLQLDDFPYVHMMRQIDNQLVKLNQPRIYYPGEDPFNDNRDWGTLCQLLNEDYKDLINRNIVKPDSAAEYLMERIDRASLAVGLPPRNSLLDPAIRKQVCEALEEEAGKMLEEKNAQYPESFENKTIIIECARGGPDGSSMPLTGAYGYQYSFPQFCPEILENAVILYIWVTPEESRRKNNARANPDDPGSNLFHGVPMSVMLGDYGCDDMAYLREHTDKADTITVNAYGKTYYLPIGVFDNRIDKTSFLRGDKETWDETLVKEVTEAIQTATDTMWENYKK
ncbi:MAG: hypothetical protein IKR11_11445 [Solobacterium sp.]|nr:hypothetical protein [Solobacterium sp.]